MALSPIPSVGFVAPGYELIRDAFETVIADDVSSGAGLSIRRDGEIVVDLAGGVADARTNLPWTLATPSVIFSSTKGIMSVLIARLVRDGLLDYDRPVADYWPEFASHGKGHITVSDALAHRAGLSAPVVDWTVDDMLDWNRATTLLAEQEPLWDPGTAWSYHAITHGWLAGELVRRVSGSLPGDYLRDLVTSPLRVDAWIGLPPEFTGDVAHMTVGKTLQKLTQQQSEQFRSGESVWPYRALTLGGALPIGLVGPDDGFNRADLQASQIPGAGGIATAHALATIWSAVVTDTDGVRLLDDSTIAAAAAVQSHGAPFFPSPAPWPRWGRGFQLDSDARHYLGESSIGHDGAGGQVAFADVENRIGFAFLTNRMEAIDDRATRIIDAVHRVLADQA